MVWRFVLQVLNIAHILNTFHADISAVVADQAAGRTTENAGRLVFFQDHLIIIQVDLQLITFRNIQGAAQFDGKYDSAQLINFSNDSSRFHVATLSFDLFQMLLNLYKQYTKSVQ